MWAWGDFTRGLLRSYSSYGWADPERGTVGAIFPSFGAPFLLALSHRAKELGDTSISNRAVKQLLQLLLYRLKAESTMYGYSRISNCLDTRKELICVSWGLMAQKGTSKSRAERCKTRTGQ